MVLEAAMICLDNSEYMRNGDYSPTRLQAQNETVNYIANAKIEGNQESCVGVLSMAGRRVEVYQSLNRNVGAIMTSLKEQVKVGGMCDFMGGLQIAQLGLKNRQNKKQAQRIIMFVGSPVETSSKELVRLGKKFKKNNIAVDIINFGAENALNDNVEKLEAFINAVNSSDNSHLVNVPPGPHVLSDLVLSSAIMSDTPGAAASVGGGGGDAGFGGVDANEDPELAMVLRMSMEEERQRQERLAGEKKAAEGGGEPATPSATSAAAATPAAPAAPTKDQESAAEPTPTRMEGFEDVNEDDEDAMLAAAIAMSMADAQAGAPGASAAGGQSMDTSPDDGEGDAADVAAALTDRNFISSLLNTVQGADNDDQTLDDILNDLGGGDDDEGDEN
mmetsp:Transcript_24281/g.34273  ORF Transcript_24281/g.34273 Transcript_24281/m.34273 type:complete len:389 (-) Transcript_24281:177-1343(-)|eukprot:CAMPEP_0175103090 /NCGR_PEP_ID=MMETSP0086_2-20121207/8860_1 /TAXON_ID=136419 /ORGANISM="Unknown Unknown, Strain D1" /LENGTH=388 /DNA_ID=CAMNT_0016378095 /DNA_START=30 /DNA_END=1196 /DNA_ORIENTATION=+